MDARMLKVLLLSPLLVACMADSAPSAQQNLLVDGTGEALYVENCSFCHGLDGSGGVVQKDVRNATTRKVEATIANRVEEMAFLSFLTRDEVILITDYIDTLDTSTRGISYAGDRVAGEALFRNACSGCHTFGGDGHLGPELMNLGQTEEWMAAFISDPAVMIAAGAHTQGSWPYVMPDLGHDNQEIWDIVEYLTYRRAEPLVPTPPVTLTEAQFTEMTDLYFDRCAGCHGLYRTGATGPRIDETRSQEIGTDGLEALLRYGTPGGMPDFGRSGLITEEQITQMAAFLQQPPPTAPPLPMADIQASWQQFVPVASRPTAPQHTRNWENYMGIILRDAGKVAIIDGDTKEEVARVDVGFAVHILRSSSTGRYFYAIGRDGVVTLIDLWTTVPSVVAQVKGCHDARSVEGSKFSGFEDDYIIEGCYWPPQYVVYDGLSLEPIARVDVPMTSIEGEVLPEVRVAAIVSSPFEPLWVISLKETGYVGLVDYSQPGFPLVSTLATERFLHDGGWDHTQRYFLVAANASNKMVVVDVQDRSFVTSFNTGIKPHPGRGANWLDPTYGWVNATPHIGGANVSVYGADPVAHPEHAWTVVRDITLPSAGSLFIKTHPASPWVFVDMALSTTDYPNICAIEKATGTLATCFPVATNGRATHLEFNQSGSEVWVSDWAIDGGLVILDSQDLHEVARIPNLPTPTGKFNVYNTAHDIY